MGIVLPICCIRIAFTTRHCGDISSPVEVSPGATVPSRGDSFR
jgi:hypothetical protein